MISLKPNTLTIIQSSTRVYLCYSNNKIFKYQVNEGLTLSENFHLPPSQKQNEYINISAKSST